MGWTCPLDGVLCFSGCSVFLFLFFFLSTAQQWLDGFSPDLHRKTSLQSGSFPHPQLSHNTPRLQGERREREEGREGEREGERRREGTPMGWLTPPMFQIVIWWVRPVRKFCIHFNRGPEYHYACKWAKSFSISVIVAGVLTADIRYYFIHCEISQSTLFFLILCGKPFYNVLTFLLP